MVRVAAMIPMNVLHIKPLPLMPVVGSHILAVELVAAMKIVLIAA